MEINRKRKVVKIHPVTRVLAILLCLLYLSAIITLISHLDEFSLEDFTSISDWLLLAFILFSFICFPLITFPVALFGRPPKYLKGKEIDMSPIEPLKLANSRIFSSVVVQTSITVALWTFLVLDLIYFRLSYWLVDLANTRESGPGFMIGITAAFGMPLISVIGLIFFLMKRDIGRFLLPTGVAFILLKDYSILFLPGLGDPGYYIARTILGLTVLGIFVFFYHDVFWYRIKNRRRRTKSYAHN